MSEEIVGREIAGSYSRGVLHINRYFRHLYGLRDGDDLVVKVISRSHTKPYRPRKREEEEPEVNKSKDKDESSLPGGYGLPYSQSKMLEDDDDSPWDDDE